METRPVKAKRFRHWLWRRRLFIATGLVLYCGAYLWLRSEHVLIHRQAVITTDRGAGSLHRVTLGDFEPKTLPGRMALMARAVAHDVFIPLRWGEEMIWMIAD